MENNREVMEEELEYVLHLGILSTRKLKPLIKVVYDMTSELRKTQSFSTFLSAELSSHYLQPNYIRTYIIRIN